jgi:hypothetical protein
MQIVCCTGVGTRGGGAHVGTLTSVEERLSASPFALSSVLAAPMSGLSGSHYVGDSSIRTEKTTGSSTTAIDDRSLVVVLGLGWHVWKGFSRGNISLERCRTCIQGHDCANTAANI